MRLARIAVAWCGGILAFFGALYLVATERMLGYAEIVNPPPTALTDLPDPRTASPEALASYRAGLAELHDSRGKG